MEIPEPNPGWLTHARMGDCTNCGDKGKVAFGPYVNDDVCWTCYYQLTGD